MHFFRQDHNQVEKTVGEKLSVTSTGKMQPQKPLKKIDVEALVKNNAIEGYSLNNKHIKKLSGHVG